MHRAVAALGVVDVHRIARHGDRIAEAATRDDVLGREDVSAHDHAALADTHEGSDLLDTGVGEARHELAQVARDLVNLFASFDLPVGIALGTGRIDAAHARHVDPDLVVGKSRDEDRARHRNTVSGRLRLPDLRAQPHGDEFARAELFGRHDVHVVDVGMSDDRVAQPLHVDTLHAEHQRRRLHAAFGVALAALHARAEGHVAVARAVDDRFGQDRFAARLALDDDALHRIPLADRIGEKGVKQYLDALLLHDFERRALDLLLVDDRQAHVVLAGAVFARRAACTQPVDEPLRRPLDDLVALAAQKTENRQTDRKVAAQKTAALDKHYAQAVARSRLGGHDAGGAAAHDQNVRLGADGNVACGFFYRLHSNSTVYSFISSPATRDAPSSTTRRPR